MPIHRPETVTAQDVDGVCGKARLLHYSDDGGLTQFGARIEVLAPGAQSAIKHWHAREDEFLMMLEGEATLHEGDATHALSAGDVVTWKAGAPLGHCVENTSDRDVRYLIVGTRGQGDTITYPDHDRILRYGLNPKDRSWTDFAGNPASNPYKD